MFLHHVFFWLKNPESASDKAVLIEGLQILSKVEVLQSFHIGVPADTNRPIIDRSYSVSWLNVFASASDEKIYQKHPLHLEFIASCSHLWDNVLIYDSESV